ncbi:MAG: DUF1572 domain-containing protein [Sphingobacteriales bacterium]|nr:MAG: DUF1572 domain-containing protein [Sphingobacteriales bacterium]
MMNTTAQLAKHLRDVHFGGNWTCVNMKDTLSDVRWQEAIQQVYTFNTIAVLVNHVSYYVRAVTKVLQGEALVAKDELSFSHAPINSADDWEAMLATVWADAEAFALLIEQVPEAMLAEDFTDSKYGTYYRNLQGIIEHMHYHLGQMVLIKKIIRADVQGG